MTISISNSLFVYTLVAIAILVSNDNAKADIFVAKGGWHGSMWLSNQKLNSSNSNLRNSQFGGEIGTNFFLWQPWFITGNTNLKMALNNTNNSVGTSISKNNNNVLSGKLSLDVLPLSKIPLSIYYQKEDSRIDSDHTSILSGSPVVTLDDLIKKDVFRLNQRYLGEGYRADFLYHNQRVSSQYSGNTSDQGAALSYSKRWVGNDLNTSISANNVKKGGTGEKNNNNSFTFSHRYYPTKEFNVTTLGSVINMDEKIENTLTSVLESYGTSVNQFTLSPSWRSGDSKTTVYGGIRAYSVERDFPIYYNLDDSLDISLRATHKWSKNLLIQGTTKFNLNRKSVDHITTSDVTTLYGEIRVGYVSDKKEINGFDYRWNANIIEADSVTDGESVITTGVDASHSFTRTWDFRKNELLLFVLQQSANRSIGSNDNSGYSFNNDTVISWSKRYGTKEIQNIFKVDLSDNRYFNNDGETGTTFISLLGSRKYKLSRRSSVSGSFTQNYSTSRSLTEGQENKISTDINLAYSMVKPFLYQVVTFKSEFHYVASNNVDSQSTYDWNNSASYKIGKTDVMLVYRLRNVDNDSQKLTKISINRKF